MKIDKLLAGTLALVLIAGLVTPAFAGFLIGQVEIDIDPGNDPNFINPLCASPIPVAILTTDVFDAFTVDVTTLAFGPSGARAIGSEFTDVDGDGDIDVVSIYLQDETGIGPADTEACLTGVILDGTPF